MNNTPKAHIELYIELTYKLAQLYQLLANKVSGESLKEIGKTLYMLNKARHFVKRSKDSAKNSDKGHPHDESIDELDELINKDFSTQSAKKFLLEADLSLEKYDTTAKEEEGKRQELLF